ncbi:La domain fused to two RRMs involved in RNA metabolism [Cryptosporidium xiaoi]|uniref:La domain fused to two RRMs involved in RNA metabolism n=1 Tax=Cryptosporidium xiaoi TaxID=659607 RepID=A0AAV9Y2W6_9CRYT
MTETKAINLHPRSPSEEECNSKRIKTNILRDETRIALLKQLEYYFSDENLKTDVFFQSNMRSDPKNRLYVEHIFNCSKVKDLGITKEEEIEETLEGHSNILLEKDEEGKLMIKLNKELPNLEKTVKQKNKSSMSGKDHHFGGCILKVTNLPENVSWSNVKDSLKEKLKNLVDSTQNLIRYVSQTTQNGTCFILLKPFKNDKTIVDNLELEFDSHKIVMTLVDQEEAKKVVSSVFPRHIQKEREKEFNKQKATFFSAPITIGGQSFASIEHLKRCLKEVIAQTKVDTIFDKENPIYKVLSSVLEYHPRYTEKCHNMHSICVKNHKNYLNKAENGNECEKVESENDANNKCFFIVRKTESGEDEYEDFSVNKCLQQLSRNPPQTSQKENKVENEQE